MSSSKSRCGARLVNNNGKEKKLPVKSRKKKPKCSKTVCDPVANVKTVTNNQTLNNTGHNCHKSPPYVRLKRLNFDVTGLIPLYNLPFSVTENVEISKSPQNKTKIKEKNTIPHIVKKLNDTSSNQRSFKDVELCSSNENHTSCNDSLCGINSASSLFSDVHEIIHTETKVKDFSSDILKMKPITENSVCNCDNACASVILDASVIADAFEFYKWQKKLQNLPSSSISSNDFPVEKLSNSNQLSSEANNSCNEETVSEDLFHMAEEEEIPRSVVKSSRKTATSELHLGAVTECITTASNYSECHTIREISASSTGTGSNSVIKSPVRGRIFPQSLRKKARQKSESLSKDKDADFSSGILDNFQNDNNLDLKICDVRGDCSDEVMQYLMEDNDVNMLINDMSFNTENENHSNVSNDEQDKFIEPQGIERSCESVKKADVVSISGSSQIDSNQLFNHPLNCNISTVNEENNRVFSVEKPDAFDRYVQSPGDKESGASIASEHTNDVHEKISVVVDELSQNNVENTTNDSSEFERVSLTKPDEQNSSSRGFYENDILADELDYEPSEAMGHYETDMLADELDYEPLEASESDMSETESCNDEIQAKQSHSDSKIPAPENPTDNASEVHEIQSDNDNNKILKDSFIGQHVKDSFFVRQKDELDNTSQLCNTTENSSDKESMESVQNNDAFANQTAHNSAPNSNDGCEHFQSNPHANYDQADLSNSFVSEHVDASLEKSSETSDREFDEMNNSGHEEDPSSFQFDKEPVVNCYQRHPLKNKAECSHKRSIDSEDDSESDSEQSFKRKISNDNQGFGYNEEENSVDEFSQSKVNSFLGKFEEVLLSIQEKCKNGKIDDALQIANNYIPISDISVQKHLFTELFFGLMESFRDSNPPLMEDVCLDTMKNTMEMFYDLNLYKTGDLNLYDTDLCSGIIRECLGLKLTSPYGQKLFAFCQKNGILIDSAAVMLYIDAIKPSEMSLMELVSSLNFVSKCKVPPPKFILKEMLNLLFQNEEDIPVSEITEVCELLCCIGSPEVDKEDIKKFVNLCIEKRFWSQIARLICAWAQKGPLITWVIETATLHLENVGFWYEELAKEIYGPGDSVPLQARFIFGQMGVRLLMEASSKKRYDSAFDVLLILHRYNINYVDYQAPMYSAVWYIKAVPNPTQIFVFPFTVAFTALDICLHLERPKDAYMIFKSFSLDLPKEFDESLKLEIRSRRFHYLLEITLALQSKDALGRGIDALRSFLSTTQKDFALDQLSEYSKDIQVAYNKYMVSFLNAQEENLIKEFYAYSRGPQKELFTLDCQVLRGIIVFFVKHDMLDEANKLFHLGCLKNIYEFGKPVSIMTPPWQMTINRDWTSEEIKLAFLRFAETLTPALRSKKTTYGFDELFSVEILINNGAKVDYEVECLNDGSSVLKRISSALKIQWELAKDKKSVHLAPESFYNFWYSKFALPSQPAHIFMVPGNVRVSFGESSTQESSNYECPTHISDIRSSESVDNYIKTETYHSDDRTLDGENALSDDSSYLISRNVPTVPQSVLRTNCNSKKYIQDNVSKNVAQFSTKKTSLTAQQDIFPHSGDNNDMLGLDNVSPKSSTPIHLSPRRAISSISSTPPRTENHVPSSSTPYLSPLKNVSTAQSQQKSFLKSPNIIVSPSAQRKSPQTFSPRSSVNSSSGITLSTATSESADQNCSFKINLNSDDSRIFAHSSPTTEQSPDLNNSQHRTPPGSIVTVKPKTVLKTCKKTIPVKTTLIKKRHSASCLKYKKIGGNILKAKAKVSKLPFDLKNIKITLQNDLTQGEAQRIVKPASGVRPAQGEAQQIVKPASGVRPAQGEAQQIVKPASGVRPAQGGVQRIVKPASGVRPAQGEAQQIVKPASGVRPAQGGVQRIVKPASGVRPAQGEVQQIVKPASGVRPAFETSQADMMDSGESNVQCNVSEDVLQKIINFLKSKVMVRRKDLTPQKQQKQALSLAQAFIQINVVATLDKRTMKLLSDFSDACI